MHILILDEEFPVPLNSGKKLRTYNLTRELARTASITYLAYSPQGFEPTELKNIGINCVSVLPPDRRQKGVLFYIRLLKNLFSKYPYIVTSHYSDNFKNKLEKILQDHKIDIIICEWTPYAIFLKNNLKHKSIIVAHNIESNIWRRYEENERSILRRWYIAIQRKKVESFEQRCFGWVDGATAVSSVEQQQISSLSSELPVKVIDNGVDTDYFSPSGNAPEPQTLVFTGSMDWRPNQDAVLFFAERVFPRLKKKFSDARFIIVGRTPPPSIEKLEEINGIVITGTVEDVRPYIDKAVIVVVPLRIGGGTRLKILEAMAMGRPVCSTTIGAEGLEIEPGRNILIADTEDEMLNTISVYFNDTKSAEQIAREGRHLVEQRYDWRPIGAKYASFLATLADK